MLTTAQRTSVHGVHDARREWQRIVELAFRCGLAALPASRPEFAGLDRPRYESTAGRSAAAS